MGLFFVFGTPIFAILFSGWVLYRTFLKRDILKYKDEVFGGLVFLLVWWVLYKVFTTM